MALARFVSFRKPYFRSADLLLSYFSKVRPRALRLFEQ